MNKAVYFYRQTFEDGTEEIRCLCAKCAKEIEQDGYKMEQIDVAGMYDLCWCGAENIPEIFSNVVDQ